MVESEFARDDGQSVYLRTAYADWSDRPGRYVLGISEDVTDTLLAEAEVLCLTQFDALTLPLNRSSFGDQAAACSQAEPLRMLSIDLDRFKAVNDQFGHPAGDAV